nr:immunoglobulin light chain junction region [Macaca mulatta]MPN65721.1 immunoglobulin light chain junction region [Macaca mulatta]MPN66146.1 immunoglobulin light chain junction region [Macaca mulatta]MPN66430.1 immunoglobulin light chain junction region [Macaca mulatta]MPN67096.1 immunoglobulin light chain junction region [Macaca mulatta]
CQVFDSSANILF